MVVYEQQAMTRFLKPNKITFDAPHTNVDVTLKDVASGRNGEDGSVEGVHRRVDDMLNDMASRENKEDRNFENDVHENVDDELLVLPGYRLKSSSVIMCISAR